MGALPGRRDLAVGRGVAHTAALLTALAVGLTLASAHLLDCLGLHLVGLGVELGIRLSMLAFYVLLTLTALGAAIYRQPMCGFQLQR